MLNIIKNTKSDLKHNKKQVYHLEVKLKNS